MMAKRTRKQKPAPCVPLGKDDKALRLTLRQEAFVKAYIENGGNASEAYRTAYPGARKWADESVWVQASRLLNAPKVSLRVKQLQESHRMRHEITVDDIVAELDEAREVARKNDTAAPMVAASLGKAKLLGLIINKSELTGKDGRPLHPSQLEPTTRDLARTVIGILREAKLETGEEEAVLSKQSKIESAEV